MSNLLSKERTIEEADGKTTWITYQRENYPNEPFRPSHRNVCRCGEDLQWKEQQRLAEHPAI